MHRNSEYAPEVRIMAKQSANAANRKPELFALTLVRVDPPEIMPLNDVKEAFFRMIIDHRSPEDWTQGDLIAVAELARLELVSEKCRQAADLLGWVDTGTATRKGGPSPEVTAYHQNFGAKMTLRRHLKLTNCSTIAEMHPRSRTFRTTQAVNAYTSEDKNDAMLLTGNDG